MKKPFISGSGGSGPKNARDSLFSGDAIEVVLGVSEGPIEGVKGNTVEEKLKNVFLDGTPVFTPSGARSFEESEIMINFEPGTPVTEVEDPVDGQTPIPYRLGGTATPVSVGVSLSKDIAVTRTVPSNYRNKYTRIEIRILVARLANITKDGAKELTARIKIEYKRASQTEWSSGIHPITGKTLTGGFVRSFVFVMADTSEDIELRVVSLDANDPETTARELLWLNYELSEALQKDGVQLKEYHPGTAMMTFVSKIGENFSRLPNLTAVWRGLLCKIPSNYDPVNRTYDETSPWDGTFKSQKYWTNNPFWLVRELITNPRFGMARYNPRVTIDDFSLYEEAKYADTPRVVDGKTIPLFTFNGVIRDPLLGLELINFILGSAHAQAIEYASGFLKIVSDRNVPAIMDVTPEMCVQQDSGIIFNYSASALKDRPNEVQATYVEPELDWQEQFVGPFRDEEAQNSQGVNIYEFKAIGCTNVYEATYKAFYRLISAQTEVLTCTFTIPLMAIGWEIYDIINIVDPDMDWGISGRARSISGTQVILRDPLYFEEVGTYDFVLQTKSGETTTHHFNIEAIGSYQQITLSTAVTAQLAPYPAFSVQRNGASPGVSKPFRIVAISRVDGAPHLRSITCVEVNRNKWQQALDGILGDKPRYNFEQPRMPEGPKNLSYLGEASLVINGELSPVVRMQWDAENLSFLGLSYAIYVSENGDPFYEAAVTRTTYYEFPIKRDIVYQFYVQLRYQDLRLNSNILAWQSYRLRPVDIIENNLLVSVTPQFNALNLSLIIKALYQLPGSDQYLDLLSSKEIQGFRYDVLGQVIEPTGPGYIMQIAAGQQSESEIKLAEEAVLSALNTANGDWSIRIRLISRDSDALLNSLPFRWGSTPVGSGGYLWIKSRPYGPDGTALASEWSSATNLTKDREIQFSAQGTNWFASYSAGHKFYRVRTVTLVYGVPEYGSWSAPVNFVDYSTVANHSRYIFVWSQDTPPAYNEFPWQPLVLPISKPQFPTITGVSLISSSRTISGEVEISGGNVPAEIEWFVADSNKVPDTSQLPDGQGNYPLKVELNSRKLAHVGRSMYGLYVGKPEMECRVWIRFKYSGYYSAFYPADVFNESLGQMVPGEGLLITTQQANFDELGLNLEKTVFVYQRSAIKPERPPSTQGTYLAPVPAGWSMNVPEGNQPLWMTSRVYYLDGTPTEWNTVTGAEQSLSVQYSPDGETDWSSVFRETDLYMRQSTDAGFTWSAAIRIVGEDGLGGKYTDFRFRRLATQPAQPLNVDAPTDWFDYPPTGTAALWMIRGVKNALGQLQGTWSNVIKISGDSGNYTEFRYMRSSTQPSTPTGTVPAGWSLTAPPGTLAIWMSQVTKTVNGDLVGSWSTPVKISGENAPVTLVQYSADGSSWHGSFQVFDLYMRQSTDNGTTWSTAIRIVGENGENGIYQDYRFIRSENPPATPTGATPVGWSDSPPSGTFPLYMSTAKKNPDGTLISVWSTPVKLTGDNGVAGARGSVHAYALTTSAAWSDVAADSVLAGAPHNGKKIADRVTLSYPAGKWSETRTWTGSAWQQVTEVVDGNLLVAGSITADKININSLFATDATITGSLTVGNGTNYVRMGGAYYIEAKAGNSQLFAVGAGAGFLDGEYLRGSSVKDKHLDSSVIDWIRNELGGSAPTSGGLKTISTAFAAGTITLGEFTSSTGRTDFNYNYGGWTTFAGGPMPAKPQIRLTIKRGAAVITTKTFDGSVIAEGYEPGVPTSYNVSLPYIDWSPYISTSTAGSATYSILVEVFNWSAAYEGTQNFRASQVSQGGGTGGGTVTWASIPNKPVMTNSDVTTGTNTAAMLVSAAQLKLAVNSFNAASSTTTTTATTATTATRLATARTLQMTGDVTWNSGSFDGSSSVSAAATLASSGVTAGSYGSASQVPVIQVDSKGRITSASTAALAVTSLSSGGTTLTANSNGWNVVAQASTLARLGLSTFGFVHAESGNIGFLSSSAVWTFRVSNAGNAVCTGTLTATDCISTSDLRVKSALEPLKEPLKGVRQLRGLTFNRLDQNNRRCAGLIAQDVYKVLPEGVYQSEGKLHVAHLAVVGLLVEAIKELDAKVTHLEKLTKRNHH